MKPYYILDGKTPVVVPTLDAWGEWMQTANRRVNLTAVEPGVEVITSFLGMDHAWDGGPPLLFETMVFGGPHDGEQWRYSTWDEAEAGHQKVVDMVVKE